jgi:thiamine pyrophosphate-dependent acetolactate synthase large subunit-like protein
MVDAKIKPVGVTPQAPDFCAIAKGFGIDAAKPASLAEFAIALKTARKSNCPFLIELDEKVAEGSIAKGQ